MSEIKVNLFGDEFPRAAVSKYHTLDSFNDRSLSAHGLEAGSPRSSCGPVLSEGVRETLCARPHSAARRQLSSSPHGMLLCVSKVPLSIRTVISHIKMRS